MTMSVVMAVTTHPVDVARPSPLRQVLANRVLRRLSYALIGSVAGRFLFFVAFGVYLYGEGGAALLGIAGLLRAAPSVLVAPFAGPLVDRYSKILVMAASDLGRAALMLLTAAAIALETGPVPVLAFATLSAALATFFEPARAALMPSLVDEPEELTAANVIGSMVNSIGYFAAPALGGVLLAVSSPEAVFVVTAVVLVASAGCVLTLRAPRAADAPAPAEGEVTGLLAEAREGFVVVAHDRGVTVLLLTFFLQVFLAGAVSVLVVVLALDTLAAGDAWVGYLNAAAGLGSLLGTVVVLRMSSRVRLSTGVLTGLALWSLPLLLAAFVDTRIAALAALLLVGIGDTIIDVNGITLLQRIVPEGLLGRIFSVLETVIVFGLGAGALATPALISLFGTEGTLVALALVTPAIGIAMLPALRALDGRATVTEHPRALLRGIPMFRHLPLPTLDALALALTPVEVADGEVIFRQGDGGDRFYIVDTGAVDVIIDGEHTVLLGAGSAFGEIALLRDVPRTATIVAHGDTLLAALERGEFLGAVTGHDASNSAAEALAYSRIARPEPSLGSM